MRRIVLVLIVVLLAGCASLYADPLRHGMSPAEARAAWGYPVDVDRWSNGDETWTYVNGAMLWFERGELVEWVR